MEHQIQSNTPVGPPPEAMLMQLLFGTLIQQSIRAVAKLGIADLLARQPQTAEDLSQKTNTHYQSLMRVLRMLSSIGIFTQNVQGQFELTPMAALLRSDVPNSMRDFAMMQGEEWNLRGAAEILYSIKTGATAQSKVHGMELFEFLSRHPEEEALFNRAMTSYSLAAIPAIVEAYNFSVFNRIADIGGGHGILLSGILKANIQVHGILFDLPSVIKGAHQMLEQEGIQNRVECMAGDFFQAVPSDVDAYILKNVIHDWSEKQIITILRNIHSAMKASAKVILIELLIPEGNEPSLSKLVDLQMLITSGGKERTEEEYKRLLEASGLRVTKIYPTKSPLSLIEAERV